MLRVVKFLFTCLSILLVLVLNVVVVIWVRSHYVQDGFVWKPGPAPHYYSTSVSMGRWRIDRGTYSFDREGHFDRSVRRPPQPILTYEKTIWAKMGFEFYNGRNSKDLPHRTVRFPIWALAGLLAIVPGIRLMMLPREIRRWRRRKKGLCLRCGYDLRASNERCPECGNEIERVASGLARASGSKL